MSINSLPTLVGRDGLEQVKRDVGASADHRLQLKTWEYQHSHIRVEFAKEMRANVEVGTLVCQLMREIMM